MYAVLASVTNNIAYQLVSQYDIMNIASQAIRLKVVGKTEARLVENTRENEMTISDMEKSTKTRNIEKPAKAGRALTKREQREASIEKILSSSLKLFISKGYRSTTVDEIAGSSQLTKGAVYFYFPTKAAILFALLDEIDDLMVNKMVDRVANAGSLLQDKLIAFIHGQSVLGIDKAEFVLLFILMLMEFNGSNDEIEARVKDIYKRFYLSIEEIVHRGKLNGEFRTDLETQEIAAIVLAMHNGTFLEWYCRSDYLSGPELVRALRGTLLTGILKKPA